MTLCNMSIEAGARAGMIAPDETTFSYLENRRFAPKGTAWKEAVSYWRTLGSAQVEIRQASSRLTTLDSLGTYRVLIQPDPSTQVKPGEGATRSLVWISTIDGALMIDGRGLIGATGFRLRAEAHAAPGSEAALDNLLNLIGRRNGASSAISIG